MKISWGLYLASSLTSVLLFSCTTRKESPLQPKSDKKTARKAQVSPPEDLDDLYSGKTNQSHFTWGASTASLSGAPVNTNNYNFLRRFEGSYSWDEMQSGETEPLSFMLQSSWLTTGTNTPEVGIRMRKSHKSGEVEFGGTELYLPRTGFGVSYEQDESEDTKTYLNIKRQF